MRVPSFSIREKNIARVCAIVAIIFCIHRIILGPVIAKIRVLQREIDTQNIHLRKLTGLIRQSGDSGVEQQYQKLAKDFQANTTLEEGMSSFLSSIESAAREQELYVSDIKPSRPQDENFYHRFSVSLVMEGPLSRVLKFLDVMQASPHFCRIDDLRVERNPRRQGRMKCHLSLSRIVVQ